MSKREKYVMIFAGILMVGVGLLLYSSGNPLAVGIAAFATAGGVILIAVAYDVFVFYVGESYASSDYETWEEKKARRDQERLEEEKRIWFPEWRGWYDPDVVAGEPEFADRNRRVVDALNTGTDFKIVSQYAFSGKDLYMGELYYALAVVEGVGVLPFPLFLKAAGLEESGYYVEFSSYDARVVGHTNNLRVFMGIRFVPHFRGFEYRE